MDSLIQSRSVSSNIRNFSILIFAILLSSSKAKLDSFFFQKPVVNIVCIIADSR